VNEQKKETKRVYVKSNPKYALPESRISFDNHLEIIKAYVVVSKNGKEGVTYRNFKTVVDLHPTIISGNNEFFEYVGLIREVEGQRGKYLPTEKAIKLYNALKWKKEEEVKLSLREMLSPLWFWNLTKQVLDVKGSTTRDEIRTKLGYESDADPKKHKTSLNVLIDYLVYAGLIKEDEDGNLTCGVTEVPSVPPEKLVETPVTKIDSGEKPIPLVQPQLVLGILLTPDMSEEQIRKCLRTIMDEWKKLSENG
jgi:hypothetical protein